MIKLNWVNYEELGITLRKEMSSIDLSCQFKNSGEIVHGNKKEERSIKAKRDR